MNEQPRLGPAHPMLPEMAQTGFCCCNIPHLEFQSRQLAAGRVRFAACYINRTLRRLILPSGRDPGQGSAGVCQPAQIELWLLLP